MWRAQYGDRILEGAEAKVFAEALSSLSDEAIMDPLDDYELSIEYFDSLTYGQRIWGLIGSSLGLLLPGMLNLPGSC